MARLVDQIREAVAAFSGLRTPPALIGGFALAAHRVVRATRDIDFLADADDGDQLDALLLGLGYRCIHRSADAANYVRGDEGIDLLYAHRPEARRLLAEAEHRGGAMGDLRVISAEGLIGFKLQGYVNDPGRSRDLDDIRELLRANVSTLDTAEVRRHLSSLIGKLCSMISLPALTAEPQRGDNAPLAASAGVAFAGGGASSLEQWMDLMEAVEALCPRWTTREPRVGGTYRL